METPDRTRVVRTRVGGSAWELAHRLPRPSLRPFVRKLVGYDERSPRPQRQRQFPEPFVVLIFEFGPTLGVALGDDPRRAVRHRGGFVAGLGDRFATTEHAGRQRGVEVDLTPTGARRFFGLPLSELTGHIVGARDLLPSAWDSLSERLEAATGWGPRLDLVEALLAHRILGSELDTARVDWAVARIEATVGSLAVGSLARALGTSRKHLIALFRDQVGVPPKLLARLVRFERVMREARMELPVRWADLAIDRGYCDQSHLARDIKHFTGLTPTEARETFSGVADLYG